MVRFARKRVRTRPARAAARAESQYIKAQADYQAGKLAQEQPEAFKSAAARLWHREKLKRAPPPRRRGPRFLGGFWFARRFRAVSSLSHRFSIWSLAFRRPRRVPIYQGTGRPSGPKAGPGVT